MHVGLLIYGEINQHSGGYLYDRQLVSHLERQGDRVEIFSLTRGSYTRELMRRSLPADISHSRPDVLIQDELVYPTVFNVNHRIREQLNCPIISLVHLLDSTRPQNPLRRRLAQKVEREYLRSTDGLILNSRYTCRKVRELLGHIPRHIIAVPAANHQDIPCGETSARRSGTSPTLNMLYAGNVIRQKGLDVVVDAMKHLNTARLHLTVAGRLDMEPGYVKEVKREIARKKLSQAVHFRGGLNAAELSACYRNSDILVLPSVNEAYGIVYIEAQRFGLPVIGTRAGGAEEIIEPGINGYLIDPGDSKTLAELLSRLLEEPEHLRRMGENALHCYTRHPGWADSCARIREFLLQTTTLWQKHTA